MQKKAILDTSALLCLYHLGLLEKLNLLFQEVRIPVAVEKEFLFKVKSEEAKNERFAFLTACYEANDTWLFKCMEYGKDLITLYLTMEGMDEGEAEALAQNQALDSSYQLIIDEKTARNVAKARSFSISGVAFLLACMEVKHGLCDYRACINRLRKELGTKFSKTIEEAAYRKAISEG